MPVDMTKAPAMKQPVQEPIEQPKQPEIELGLTRDELDTIRKALIRSKNLEAYISVIEGAKEYKILVDLEKL